MRRVVICGLSGCTAIFSTLSRKRHDYRKKKKVTELKILFLFSLQILSETFLILTRTERDVVINVHRSSRKVSVVIVILMKTEFSRQIF